MPNGYGEDLQIEISITAYDADKAWVKALIEKIWLTLQSWQRKCCISSDAILEYLGLLENHKVWKYNSCLCYADEWIMDKKHILRFDPTQCLAPYNN